MDATDLKESLTSELATLLARRGRIDDHLRHTGEPLPDDWAERAQAIAGDEVVTALDATTRGRIEEIKDALQRIDDGTFGMCAGCGGQIAPERLRILPTARLCVRCSHRAGH